MSNKVVLKMENIDKRFPGVHALKRCSLTLREGEVNALAGENGAGKSTLMKILTGIYQRDEGEITTPFKIVQRTIDEEGVLKLQTEVYYNGSLIKSHTTNY